MEILVYPGSPYPLGASWDGNGVNFAIYSEHATAIELCLFNEHETEIERVVLPECSHHVWHAYIPQLQPGQLYGYRVYGPFEPHNGHWFNPNKLLIDPYAKALSGLVQWNKDLFDNHKDDGTIKAGENDTAAYVPKCVVVDERFDWEYDAKLKIPYHKTIIYEAHVKGLTQLHPEIPDDIKGTYAAISHPVIISHLQQLGITAIELQPVQYFVSEQYLEELGLTNYWGYNTIGFFAPEIKYAHNKTPGSQVNEFKNMVKALHKAGIEVILDVVYNHTAEGNEYRPTISFKGIDNSSYYRLEKDNELCYTDYSGTGNTLNVLQPNVLMLIMDSLRYWIQEMHVDGFRFDLAAALARGLHDVDRLGDFFNIIYQDPIISQVKLIAEPWDIAADGYQVGNFPPGWAEWNGKYRDCVRDYWREKECKLEMFAKRFTGSPDLYKNDYRNPTASINYITSHDGFTLRDLVSYKDKHNQANQDDNEGGGNDNNSDNNGVEGDTDDPNINAFRKKQVRNFLTTLMLSQGVPMIVAGDEMGRTQGGNNNSFCQDNEISWVNWEAADLDLLNYTRSLAKFFKAHIVFGRKHWFQGKNIRGTSSEVKDISWFKPDGNDISDESWDNDFAKSLAVYLNGKSLTCLGDRGEKVTDNSFYVIFNADSQPLNYKLPKAKFAESWLKVVDSHNAIVCECENNNNTYEAGTQLKIEGHAITVLMSNDMGNE